MAQIRKREARLRNAAVFLCSHNAASARTKNRLTHLHRTILHLCLQLFLGSKQPFPNLLPDTAFLEQRVESWLPGSNVYHTVDVLGAAGEECGAQYARWDFRRRRIMILEVEEREIYISRCVWWKVWSKGEVFLYWWISVGCLFPDVCFISSCLYQEQLSRQSGTGSNSRVFRFLYNDEKVANDVRRMPR